MRWIVAAPFIVGPGDTWLDRYVPGSRHRFDVVRARYAHDRSRKLTAPGQWRDYFVHGHEAWRACREQAGPAGIVTLFPQLALTVGLTQRLAVRHTPVLAWTFNLGRLYHGARRRASRFALRQIDRFVVHSRHEVGSYSDWLDLPPDRFRFVPLQRPARPIEFGEDMAEPFILAMGSAQRDYRLLFDVLRDLRLRAVVVAGPKALEGLRVPDRVEVLSGVDLATCHRLAQQARINVVPIDNADTASGQVTVVDAMMFARPTVATRSIGTEDYIEHGRTGVLVPAGDRAAMRDAISLLWDDPIRRAQLGAAARQHVIDHLSDEAAGATLGRLLDEVADELAR